MPHVYALLSKVRARCLIIANAAPHMAELTPAQKKSHSLIG
jgi:hypothetical protein